jgi:hypothetical protein
MEGRQRLSDPDLFLYHPPNLTDSFTLYLKAHILASRVVDFNGAIRIRRQSDYNNGASVLDAFFVPSKQGYSDNIRLSASCDLDYDPSVLSENGETQSKPIESSLPRLRDDPKFLALDASIASFLHGIPKGYRNPFYSRESSDKTRGACPLAGLAFDIHLYCAHMLLAL